MIKQGLFSGFLDNTQGTEWFQTPLTVKKKRPAEAGRRTGDAVSGGAINRKIILKDQNVKTFEFAGLKDLAYALIRIRLHWLIKDQARIRVRYEVLT